MGIIEDLKAMQQKIDDNIEIVMMSNDFAKKILVSSDELPQNILIMLNEVCENDKVYIFQGEVKKSILKQYRHRLIKLYDFKELRIKIFGGWNDYLGGSNDKLWSY